ncbi:MAG TPA: FG-GAP-like repeat-containing protein [Vicinamibacterales bacterium]|nr:FG-GAP-like repeat-containing protein [Vicinamibacterales bacterium]
MFRLVSLSVFLALAVAAAGVQPQPSGDALARHRNLGKAFYENPTTQQRAVEEFKAALDLAPDSVRERVNYGLALLRAGRTADGVAELERAQKQDPSIPHTWFNLGVAYKKDSQYAKAIPQFEQMVKLVPDEPVSHYNLGYLYKVTDRPADALREFERAAALDPSLAGPHFQLYNAYRDGGRDADAAREQQLFQDIKRSQAGAAVPEDLDWSFYAEILDPADPRDAADSAPPARLAFSDRRLDGTFSGANAGVLAIDADGDGRADLLVWSSDGVRLLRNGDTPVPDAGLDGIKDVRSVAAGDFNNDGLPDLCVVTGTGAELYVNGAGRFAKSPISLPAGSYAKAVWIDYDHDYDEDLLLVGDDSRLMRNDGRAGFSDHTADLPLVGGHAADAIVFDLMNNTIGHDLAISYADRPGVVYRDLLGGKYRAVDLPALPAGSRSLSARDVDNDGWLDLLAAGPSGPVLLLGRDGSLTAAPVSATRASSVLAADFENRAVADIVSGGVVLRNQSQGRFAAPGATVLTNAVALVTADFDNDGRIDAAGIAADGSLHLLHNDTETRNTFVRLTLLGVRNPKLAPQAQVEVKSGQRYQKQTYAGVPLVFGLRGSTAIDTIRVTWPNGLIQNELAQPVGTALPIKEAQRLSGSCPMIFTWNGRAFQFITDVLGVAPLGASSGDGTYFPVDHDEYVQIPGSALTLEDAAYKIRITEELHEVSYLDQVQLIALDHPSNVEIFTNDKFKSPPFPEFRLFGTTERRYPITAVDDGGRDVRRALMARDHVYPDRFARSYSGVAEPHVLDLDFGSVARDNRAVLILNGWVDWADGSTFLGASQEDPRGLMLPSLQVRDRSGAWVTVVEDMGIPAGKPKTIAVDLTGKFLSASREVQIVTNLCVYWDEIFLIEHGAAPKTVLTRINASSVDLRFRGFSAVTIDPERTQPESFDYSRVSPLSMWNPTPGLYTRYGDVTPLLHAIDDRLVVMGSGDEIALTFPAAGLPPLPRGWTRDFLLLVDGWAKDADPNTAFSQSVEPLPFHAMSAYPYRANEHFPDDPLHRAYLLEYNTRPALRLLRPLTTPAGSGGGTR